MSNFQTILIAIFLSFAVFAVLIFSGAIKIGQKSDAVQGKVVIWGTFPKSVFSQVLENVNFNNDNLSLTYEQIDKSVYQQKLVEAFANGEAPDLYIVTPDMLLKNDNFIYKIPYTSYPLKTFTDAYIEGANIYLDGKNVLGFPLVVDPMVLYYNKDILINYGIVYPPKTWDELYNINNSLTKRDNAGTISQSMIALGQYENVNNAEDILATLLIQNGNPIVERGSEPLYLSTLGSDLSKSSISSLESVARFYIQFSNPSNSAYSWNRSLPNSLDMFTSGKLAFYLGKASELFKIQSINPNLSFDVTQIPQIKDSPTKRTFGDIYAIVLNKKSGNLSSASSVASMLSKGDNASNLSKALSLPPASKVLLSAKPESNAYLSTFFDSALATQSWLDPDKNKSDLIFKEFIENMLSNSLSIGELLNKAQNQLQLLLTK